MPIYEYLCPECNRIFSFMVSTMSDERTPKCPRCGADDMAKRISLFAFVRGGTNPLAAIPKAVEDHEAPAPDGGAPVRDDGLYFLPYAGGPASTRRP